VCTSIIGALSSFFDVGWHKWNLISCPGQTATADNGIYIGGFAREVHSALDNEVRVAIEAVAFLG
jgi:hypothetical protein